MLLYTLTLNCKILLKSKFSDIPTKAAIIFSTVFRKLCKFKITHFTDYKCQTKKKDFFQKYISEITSLN